MYGKPLEQAVNRRGRREKRTTTGFQGPSKGFLGACLSEYDARQVPDVKENVAAIRRPFVVKDKDA